MSLYGSGCLLWHSQPVTNPGDTPGSPDYRRISIITRRARELDMRIYGLWHNSWPGGMNDTVGNVYYAHQGVIPTRDTGILVGTEYSYPYYCTRTLLVQGSTLKCAVCGRTTKLYRIGAPGTPAATGWTVADTPQGLQTICVHCAHNTARVHTSEFGTYITGDSLLQPVLATGGRTFCSADAQMLTLHRRSRVCECGNICLVYPDLYPLDAECELCGSILNNAPGETHLQIDVEEEEVEEEMPGIHSYDYKPTPRFKKLNNDTSHEGLYYGMEIEINCHEEDDKYDVKDCIPLKNSPVYAKRDGSLWENGIELVTHPATMDYWHSPHMNCVWDCLETAERADANTDDDCGIHIHISRTYLDKTPHHSLRLDLLFEAMYRKYGTAFCMLVGRSPTSYCAINGTQQKSLRRIAVKGYGDRYVAVNHRNENTVEIRSFKTSLDKTVVLSYLEFVDACVQFSKDQISVATLRRQSRFLTRFLDFIFAEKKYKNLQYIIRQNRIGGYFPLPAKKAGIK